MKGAFMDTKGNPGLVEILLVEDDSDDVQLVKEALEEGQVPAHVAVVQDGVQALAYLRREGEHASAVMPDLMFLDLKMPKKGGFEVLAEIKADDVLRRIPVIVLTTSDAPEDILKAYDLQASCFINKPADLNEFQHVMDSIQEFCLTVVKLPPRV
jgi:two-component system, chemotaxis family, response regulator Rcp1